MKMEMNICTIYIQGLVDKILFVEAIGQEALDFVLTMIGRLEDENQFTIGSWTRLP